MGENKLDITLLSFPLISRRRCGSLVDLQFCACLQYVAGQKLGLSALKPNEKYGESLKEIERWL